jgi:NADPH:quinone reductase-like Zn-dependent oxidoreductase
VPQPGPAELLVHVVVSSLNPLDYKLADLNFVGRTPPAVLGFDLAGIVVGRGGAVTRFALGNAVFGMIATQSGRRLGRRRRGRLCAGARLRRRAHAKPAWKL